MTFSIKQSRQNPEKTIITENGRIKIAEVNMSNRTVSITQKLSDFKNILLSNFCNKEGLNLTN